MHAAILGVQYASASTITYTFAGDGALDRGNPGGVAPIADELHQAKVETAFSAWTAIANIRFAEASDPSTAHLSVYWDAVDGDGGTLGYATLSDPDGDGLIEGAAVGEVSRIGIDPDDEISFDQVVLHEVGHILGLAHTTAYWSVMHPENSQASSIITSGDVGAIRSLYGPAISTPTVIGTEGDDTLWRTGQVDWQFRALDGDDTAFGAGGNDIVYGNHGDDVLYGGYGRDTVYGGQHNDHLNGHYGADVLYGNLGLDTIDGTTDQGEADWMNGGQHNDQILAGANDTAIGGLGNDTLIGEPGAILVGGDGADLFVTDVLSTILDYDAEVDRILSRADWLGA